MVVFRLLLGMGYPSSDACIIKDNCRGCLYPYTGYVSHAVARADKNSIFYDMSKDFFLNIEDDAVRVAFFAGSTGIIGRPAITSEIQKALEKKFNKKVFVANFSMLAGRIRQHMHMLLEFMDRYQPDIVIFYDGYNELIDQYFGDTRIGYPFNFFYVELPLWKKMLIRYSAVFGELEYRYNILSKYDKLMERMDYGSDEHCKNIINEYFDVMEKSKTITENIIKSKHYSKPVFYAFYQPYKDDGEEDRMTETVRNRIKDYNYFYDLHDAYQELPQDVWLDNCHVQGLAHVTIAEKISDIVYNDMKSKKMGLHRGN